MATTPKRFFRGASTAALVTVYTAPAGTTAIVTHILLANVTSSAISTQVQLGGVYILRDTPIPPNGTISLDMRQVLVPGETIKIQSNVNAAMTAHISGVEVTG